MLELCVVSEQVRKIIKIYKLSYILLLLVCSDGDIRLVGSQDPLEGRVELCYDGVWGTVCSNQWSNADAAVVCRQLSYSSSGLCDLSISIFSILWINFIKCAFIQEQLPD